jgi:hypothetical protein
MRAILAALLLCAYAFLLSSHADARGGHTISIIGQWCIMRWRITPSDRCIVSRP